MLAALAAGARAFDEPGLDALSHALQCGDLLRREHPADPQLAVAGLVHDVADAVSPDHTDHERRGAALVAPLLGPRVAKLVGAHVVAKRYLVATDPTYRARLSDRSAETLAQQGEALDARLVRSLARAPDLDAILALRRADERAKVPGAVVPALDAWRDLLHEVAR